MIRARPYRFLSCFLVLHVLWVFSTYAYRTGRWKRIKCDDESWKNRTMRFEQCMRKRLWDDYPDMKSNYELCAAEIEGIESDYTITEIKCNADIDRRTRGQFRRCLRRKRLDFSDDEREEFREKLWDYMRECNGSDDEEP